MTKHLTFPNFSPRFPWLGGDLQTIRNTVLGPLLKPETYQMERLILPMTDGTGDRLNGLLQSQDFGSNKPLVVLIHGLTGDEESPYMQTSAAYFLQQGHNVIRLNLRGSGPSRHTCKLLYHAGRTKDLRDALKALPDELKKQGLFLMGFSLGGNMLLKFAAEYGLEFPVKAVASVSAPIDLMASNIQMLKRRNIIYQKYVLHSLKQDALGGTSEVTESERQAIIKSRSIYEFDDSFNGPRNGYSSAEEYYEKNKALAFMYDIPIPALVIHALNDPWVPGKAYVEYPWHDNKNLVPLLASRGGHAGFHSKNSPVPWHDRCAEIFFSKINT